MAARDRESPEEGERLRPGGWLLIVSLSLASLFGAGLSLPHALAGDRAFAVVFPPWTTQEAAVARSFAAGYRVLRGGVWPFVVIAAPPDEAADTVPALAGAWRVALDGLAGCLDPGSPLSSRTP